MYKKFEIDRTKIKGGCQSGRKVVTHKSDLPQAPLTIVFFMRFAFWTNFFKLQKKRGFRIQSRGHSIPPFCTNNPRDNFMNTILLATNFSMSFWGPDFHVLEMVSQPLKVVYYFDFKEKSQKIISSMDCTSITLLEAYYS